jgi:hypothetical protein
MNQNELQGATTSKRVAADLRKNRTEFKSEIANILLRVGAGSPEDLNGCGKAIKVLGGRKRFVLGWNRNRGLTVWPALPNCLDPSRKRQICEYH